MSAQLSIDFNALSLARSDDPETSKRAAQRVSEFGSDHASRCYAAILAAGERGATYREIALATGLSEVQVARRMSGLGDAGLIERRLVNPTGCTGKWIERDGCAVWWKKA